MTKIEKHPTGSFCWIELGTTDQSAAKDFYGAVFGWQVNDIPMGPDDYYTIFNLDGDAVGAAYTIKPEQKAMGVPPHWMIYVAVDNTDQTTERAIELGAKALAGPFDAGEFGRMTTLQDPTGAIISIWQAKQHAGSNATGVPGTLCWADLNTRDIPAATKFYSELFGWKITAGDKDPSGYLHIVNGEAGIGGVPPSQHMGEHTPPHWMPYILVTSCDETAAKAKAGGAKFYMEPMTMEGVGRMAVIADPQGAVFALFEPGHSETHSH